MKVKIKLPSKKRLVRVLGYQQRTRCTNDSFWFSGKKAVCPKTCPCILGNAPKEKLHTIQGRKSGCPELRMAVAILEAMSVREYNRLKPKLRKLLKGYLDFSMVAISEAPFKKKKSRVKFTRGNAE